VTHPSPSASACRQWHSPMQLAVACPGATWRLTAIYLCNPCSCQEILEVARHGPLGRHERGVEADLVVVYRMPLAEVIGTHFHDKIKAASSGFASFDYAEAGYEKARAAPSLLAPRPSPLAPRLSPHRGRLWTASHTDLAAPPALHPARPPAGAHLEATAGAQRRARGCAERAGAQAAGDAGRQAAGQEAQRHDPAAAVRHRHPGKVAG
jgi:hypothetical protein